MQSKQARVKWKQTGAIRIRLFVVKGRLGLRSIAVVDGREARHGRGTGRGQGSQKEV